MMDYADLCEKTKEIVVETASYIRSERESNKELLTEIKGKHNFVTHVDKEVEKMLVTSLSGLLPEAGFIAEEGTSTKKGDIYNWIIDPVDGTTNFIHGLSPFAISVALMEKEEIVIGVVYELGMKECFYAWKGGPAMMNGNPIRVTDCLKVSDSLIATGFPYTNFTYMDGFMDSVKWFMENSHGLRRLGSAATDIAYVACGRFDGFFEYGLNAWDIAAGVLILQQAGGKIDDFDGKGNYLKEGEIIASNAEIFDEFQTVVRKLIKG